MSTFGNVGKVWEKARAVRTSVIGVLVRHIFFRLRGKNIITSNRVRIQGVANIETKGLFSIGMTDYGFVSRNERTFLNVCGKLEILGQFALAKGCRLHVGEGAVVKIHGGYISPMTNFVIMHGLSLGKGCAISWGCQFLDEDFHQLSYEGKVEKEDSRIEIGEHVWIGSRVSILKGVVIPNGCVVASGSVVTKRFTEENALIAGNPARVIKENVTWSQLDGEVTGEHALNIQGLGLARSASQE